MGIHICGAPCCWGVDDITNPHLPTWQRVLREAHEAGYSAIELGPNGWIPTDDKMCIRDRFYQHGAIPCVDHAHFAILVYESNPVIRTSLDLVINRLGNHLARHVDHADLAVFLHEDSFTKLAAAYLPLIPGSISKAAAIQIEKGYLVLRSCRKDHISGIVFVQPACAHTVINLSLIHI